MPSTERPLLRLAIGSNRDLRTNRIRWQNAENHDDITAIDFHPMQQNLVLVGSDDGLVSIFDVSIPEEDEALVQAVNHGPIHKAGFLHSDAIYALSSDQNLALHPIYSLEREQEPSPVLLGDLRPVIPCEYIIDVIGAGTNFAVAAGSHRLVTRYKILLGGGLIQLASLELTLSAFGREESLT